MENKRMSELPVATVINDEDYTIIVQNGINKRVNRGIFKQKDYNNLNNIPYLNTNFSSSLLPTKELIQGTIELHKISKTGRYGDLLDLPFIPERLTDLTNDGYFVQDQYYVHTDNNLTSGIINKIDSAIQAIKVNNTLINPTASREVNIIMPTKLTEFINDGNFVQDQYYVHTDNNFTTNLKNGYDNLVSNVNQPVSSNNKIATMNDITTTDSGYWIPIEDYKTTIFKGVINPNGSIPSSGVYAVLSLRNGVYVVNKYTNGSSDNKNIIARDGYFVFVQTDSDEDIYYINSNKWERLGGTNSTVIPITQADVINALGYTPASTDVVTTSSNGLMSSTMLSKLNGITESADSVSFTRSLSSGTQIGYITINGSTTYMYAPTNTDTHYTTYLYVGTSSGSSNAATANGRTHLIIYENSTVRCRRLIQGTGGTTVSSDSSGTITINSQVGVESVLADFMYWWNSVSDGTNMLSYNLTLATYEKMAPGLVLRYQHPQSSTSYCYALILGEKTYSKYVSSLSRYVYVRDYYMYNYNGSLQTYSFSTLTQSDYSAVYKGSNANG